MDEKHAQLQKTFGYTEFRPGQERLIDAILAGQDVLGIMPTGGGKSICYQIPALLSSGITLVVSPLISLMKDQVMALKAAGVAAAYINSSLTPEQIRLVYRRFREGWYRIVYIAPERLLTEGFLSVVQEVDISLLAVDEAHCISQWGQDFRPSYLKIPDFIRELPVRPPVAAFTATATEQVRKDIVRSLELHEPFRLVTGFDRPNLFFDVLRTRDREAELFRLLKAREGKSGIVYCSTRRSVEELCDVLCSRGLSATRYHAGLDEAERRQNQEDFTYDRKSIMVATNAFGMGIDKSNVSFVIHCGIPTSLEAYYQEAGRAGRDGSAADCILLWDGQDVKTAQFFVEHSAENPELEEAERERILRMNSLRLSVMLGYCRTSRCLRSYILDYFGQENSGRCGHCGTCLSDTVEQDATREGTALLSAVEEIGRHLGYPVGLTLVMHTLRGTRNDRTVELKLYELTCFGALRLMKQSSLRELAEALIGLGYLQQKPPYSTLVLTPAGRSLLRNGEPLLIRTRKPLAPAAPRRAEMYDGQERLLERLKALRRQIAAEDSVPAYVVFSNATLEDMARAAPTDMHALLTVSGVGQAKARKYGKRFLEAIRQLQESGGA